MHLTAKSSGLNHIKWARWKQDLLNTGSYDPNRYDELDSYQKKWTADTLNTLKALSKNQDGERF